MYPFLCSILTFAFYFCCASPNRTTQNSLPASRKFTQIYKLQNIQLFHIIFFKFFFFFLIKQRKHLFVVFVFYVFVFMPEAIFRDLQTCDRKQNNGEFLSTCWFARAESQGIAKKQSAEYIYMRASQNVKNVQIITPFSWPHLIFPHLFSLSLLINSVFIMLCMYVFVCFVYVLDKRYLRSFTLLSFSRSLSFALPLITL